jgi:hypothetical protein
MLTLTPQQLSLQFRDMLTALRMTGVQLVDMLGHEPRLFKVVFIAMFVNLKLVDTVSACTSEYQLNGSLTCFF